MHITKRCFLFSIVSFLAWPPGVARGEVVEVEPNDSLQAAQDLEGEPWSLEQDPDIGDTTTDTSTTLPHVTILGMGDGTYDVFSFTVAGAGDRGIFDIDYGTTGGGIDAYLRLYDGNGSLIASDDDSPTSWGQGGSVSGLDSYIEIFFPDAGTHYIEVGSCCVGPVPTGGDYELQVSIENHSTGPVFALGRLVYLGLDPSDGWHAVDAEARVLAGNAARWAGRGSDPKVAYCEGSAGFSSEVGTRLAEAGLSDLTEIPAAALAEADLSEFDVLYVGPTTDVSDLMAARLNLGEYGASGGGLVVEPNVFDPDSWSWVPYAHQIGHSGATNVDSDDVYVIDHGHPVMAGLTDAGLSGWYSSVHSTFTAPEAAGFSILAAQEPQFGVPVIIARDGLGADIFADGFESGDVSAWSSVP